MPKVSFLPKGESVDIPEDAKLLAAAIRAKTNIRYGCSACRCGTCGVLIVKGKEELSVPKENEISLLTTMKLPLDGSVRLACQSRLGGGDVIVDLAFQNIYSPDSGIDV